MQVLYLATVR